MSLSKTLFAAALAGIFSSASAATTALYYTGNGYVGGGVTATITPGSNFGFDFTVRRNYDNGVSFAINDFRTNPNFQNTRWWYLDFAAPGDAPLTVGNYTDAQRWPFQAAGHPGLNFSGNGRGNNTLTGEFRVLEARYNTDGSVAAFAANFVQYDYGNINSVNRGAIRYNSEFSVSAVPEPSTWASMAFGLAGLAFFARRRAAKAARA